MVPVVFLTAFPLSTANALLTAEQLDALLDELTPFYQDRMKELAPHEAASNTRSSSA